MLLLGRVVVLRLLWLLVLVLLMLLILLLLLGRRGLLLAVVLWLLRRIGRILSLSRGSLAGCHLRNAVRTPRFHDRVSNISLSLQSPRNKNLPSSAWEEEEEDEGESFGGRANAGNTRSGEDLKKNKKQERGQY